MANEPKEISFHFYQSKISATTSQPENLQLFSDHPLPPPPSLHSIFQALIDDQQNDLPSKIFGKDHTREIREIEKVKGFYIACFVKLQHDNLPKTSLPNSKIEKDLKLDHARKEGLVSSNWFLVVPQHNILIFQQNRNGSTAKQLVKYLNSQLQAYLDSKDISLISIIESGAWKKLMNDQIIIRKLELKVANNSPHYLPDNDWDANTFSLLAASNGSTINIKISADLRNKNPKFNRLRNAIVTPIRKLITGTDNIESARFHVKQHPDKDEEIIDMVTQRMNAIKLIEMPGSYPSPSGIKRALLELYYEKEAAVNEILNNN